MKRWSFKLIKEDSRMKKIKILNYLIGLLKRKSNIFLFGFLIIVLINPYCKKSETRTYVNKANEYEYIELKADGTFFVQQKEYSFWGKYEIDGNNIIFKLESGLAAKARINGEKIIDDEGEIWIKGRKKTEEIEIPREVTPTDKIEGLFKRYFHALSLRDQTTMSTMAMEHPDIMISYGQPWEIKTIRKVKTKSISYSELDEKELDVVLFSLGARDLNLDNFRGNMSFTEAIIDLDTSSGQKRYKFDVRKYDIEDPVSNLLRKGRWIIYKFEYLKK